MAARGAIRDVGRALGDKRGYSYKFVDVLAKMVPEIPGITLEEALVENINFGKRYKEEPEVKYIVDLAMRLEGVATYTSTHAAGVLITDEKGVDEHVPIWSNDGVIVAQFDMRDLEDLKLLKMDFLGLSTLTVLKYTMKYAKENHGAEFDLNNLYTVGSMKPTELIHKGFTEGLFQLENDGMTGFLREMKPSNMAEWIAGIALYRPGPMDSIPEYLAGKRNPNRVHYPFEAIKDILHETYGVLTYQEQVMRAVVEIAGYDKSDADSFRKVIGKKKLDLIPLHRKWFIEGREIKDYDEHGKLVEFTHAIPGGLAKGYNRADLEKFFDLMEEFGKYAFNKSHSAAYAILGYRTACLKWEYPAEYMAALMTVELKHGQGGKSTTKKISKYIGHCRNDLKIRISPPDINEGEEGFTPTIINGRSTIIYPLDVRDTSKKAVKAIVEDRKNNGPFKTYFDFIFRNRNSIDLGTLRGLSAVGAFKSSGVNTSYAVANAPRITKRLQQARSAEKRAEKSNRRFNFIEWLRLEDHLAPDMEEVDDLVQWSLEKHYMGIYLTGNPIEKHMFHVNTVSDLDLSELDYSITDEGLVKLKNPMQDGRRVAVVGMFTSILRTATRKVPRKPMAICEFSDLWGSVKSFVFPRQYANYGHMVEEDQVVCIRGTLQVRQDEPPAIIVDTIEPLEYKEVEALEVYFETPEDARSFIAGIRASRLTIGDNPVYVNVGNLRILVDRPHWCRLENMRLDNIRHKITKI